MASHLSKPSSAIKWLIELYADAAFAY